MRRSRSEDGDEQDDGASGVVAASSGGEPHPVLTRPAFLSHIFKFVVRKHTYGKDLKLLDDVKLLYVHTAWEDTAVNYSPWMWQRLLPSYEQPPPLEGTPTVEQVSQHFFNVYVCRVWARTWSCTPSIYSRLVAPRVVDLNQLGRISDADLVHLGKHVTITELHLRACHITDTGLAHISGLQQLQKLDLDFCGKITDAGVQHLAGLKNLKKFWAGGCYKITAGAKAQFEQARPNCDVWF
jgi:hypothetical protein